MARTTHLGTLLLLLAIGCARSNGIGESLDAGPLPVDNAIFRGDLGRAPDLGPPGACRLDVDFLGPDRRGMGGDLRIAEVSEGSLLLTGATGGDVRLNLGGLSTDGVQVGQPARMVSTAGWLGLHITDGPLFYVRSDDGFTPPPDGVIEAPVPGLGLTLLPGCRQLEATGRCGRPPGDAVQYDLAFEPFGGELPLLVAAGTTAGGSTMAVHHGGAASFPGYSSANCVAEAGFEMSLALRLTPGDALCRELEAAYEGILEPRRSCVGADDCVVLFGQCGVGLGGCYESANEDVQDDLNRLGLVYGAAGCTDLVCDCIEPPAADCVDGACGFR